MGTRYTVRIAGEPLATAAREAARAAIEAELGTVDRLMSTWRDDSEISRFNRLPVGEAMPLSAEAREVLEEALRVSAVSDGAFDVTVAPLVRAWGFGSGGRMPRLPDEEEIERLRARVGRDAIVLDEVTGSIRKARGGVECDLSAIAPGFASDRIAAALVRLGHRHALVDVGGEIRAVGERAPGRPWRVAVAAPDGGRPGVRVALRDGALATSGDYRDFWVDETGGRHGHVLDPRSGRPLTHDLASVSVVRPTAMEADALATALLVLGWEDGRTHAAREGWAAHFVRRRGADFEVFSTPGFAALETPS
jgi:thiamine biosynthesis lipoprotein